MSVMLNMDNPVSWSLFEVLFAWLSVFETDPVNLVVVSCIGVLKLLSINWYMEYLMRDMAASAFIRAL